MLPHFISRPTDENIAQCRELDGSCRLYIQKLANAAENAFADQAILLDENLPLFGQNNEKNTSTGSNTLSYHANIVYL